MPVNQSEPKAVTTEEALLALLKSPMRSASIAPGAELGEAVRKTRQKVERFQRREAQESFHEKIAIGNAAEELGLTGVRLSGLQLRGALLAIVEGAKNPANLAAFEAAGKAWHDRRRPARAPGTFRVFITAATISAELAEACTEARLRRVLMPKGFAGRLALAQALELGRRFSATVHVQHKGEEQQLLDRGVVDADVLGKLTDKPGEEVPVAQIANEPENIVSDADDTLLALAAGEAPAVVANANDDDAMPAEAEAATDQHKPARSLQQPLSR